MEVATPAIVYSRAQLGISAPLVTVEVHIAGGLPQCSIVGLPETAVRESKDRVRGALANSGFDYPSRRITVNLAPADLPKSGGRFDLPIAIGILAASRQVPKSPLPGLELLGELALTGELRATGGCLPAAIRACAADRALIVPGEDATEAALVRDVRVLTGTHLADVCAHLTTGVGLERRRTAPAPTASPIESDLAEVRGQYRARRALEIAAVGEHNMLLQGPPGTGKTMLATRLPGILPEMSEEQALESAAVWSVSDRRFEPANWRRRPFRAPHHSASAVALVGGGARIRPGEVSLAHHGVLFLDELPEFDRHVLEALREPLESGRMIISRAARQAEYPARIQLIGAMNPCPCGHLGDGTDRCRCSPEQIHRYRGRISGPLLDRIDLHVETPPTREDPAARDAPPPSESTPAVRARVQRARDLQLERYGKPVARLAPGEVEQHCRLAPAERRLLQSAVTKLGLSARGHHRVLRVARTIADMSAAEAIAAEHLAEAISFRMLDRKSGWD